MEENKIGNISTINNDTSFGIKSDNSPFSQSFYFNDFYDENAIKRFIKSTERLIRTSREYKSYIEQLRTNVTQLNHDNILSNITTADVDLEFHHYPLTLYDIVEIVMIQNFINNKNFTSFSLAKQVMELHYKHLIGLVPLTKMNHELAHKNAIFISVRQIFGDWEGFCRKYNQALSNDIKVKIKEIKDKTNNNALTDYKGLF